MSEVMADAFENPHPTQDCVPVRTIATPLPAVPERLIRRRPILKLPEAAIIDYDKDLLQDATEVIISSKEAIK